MHFCKYAFEQQHGQFWQATGRFARVYKNGASMDLAHGVNLQSTVQQDANSGGEDEEQTLAFQHDNNVAPVWTTVVRVMSSRQCTALPAISKILEPAESQRLGRLLPIFKSVFKDFRKAGHNCGWMECVEPGGLRRSAQSGAIQDRKRRAMLVAQISNPMRCSSVLLRNFLLPRRVAMRSSSLTSLVFMSWMVS